MGKQNASETDRFLMRKIRRHFLRQLFLLPLAIMAACDSSTKPAGPRYVDAPTAGEIKVLYFAVHPLHNPKKLVQTYQPLIDKLNRQLHGVRLELEASRDYAVYEEKFRRRAPEFLLANPWQTLEAIKVGYAVIAMAGDPADFKGLILIRKDSGIKSVNDLKGKEVSYPSPTALAGCIMPQAFLQAQGLDVMHDIKNRYVGSQESSIMNVYLKQSSAGATWPPPWRAFQKDHPREAAQLKVAWVTAPLINNSVMVRDDVPAAITAEIRAVLLHLHDSVDGRKILASMETARFPAASNEDYEPAKRFVAEFERTVRKVEDRS